MSRSLPSRRWIALAVLVAATACLFVPLPTGVSVPLAAPAPEPEFWRAPTSQIGMPEGLFGSEITPAGDLYTGYEELDFGYGYQDVPGRICPKRRLGGFLPIVRYDQEANGILYALEAFGTSIGRRADGPLVDLIAVTLTNPNPRPREAYLTAKFRFRQSSVYRTKPRVAFDPGWVYQFRGNAAIRDDQILGIMADGAAIREGYPGQRFHEGSAALSPGHPFLFRGTDAGVGPTDPILQSIYRIALPPYGQRRLVFKVPHPPANLEDQAALERLNYDAERRRVVALWRDTLDRAAELSVPDGKLVDLARAAAADLFIGLDLQGDGRHPALVPRVNELQYDGFYLRDGAYMVRALDLLGYADEAGRCLSYFLTAQKSDGRFESQPGQLDGWGQALWGIGQHARITGDGRFERRMAGPVRSAVAWLQRARRTTRTERGPGAGLLPAADPHDNEQIGGHLFGNDFWACRGLSEAVGMARDLGLHTEESAWSGELVDYLRVLLSALETATARTGGYIPPAVEPGGLDWGNYLAVYPGEALPADHPWVTATLRHARAHFTEGLATYGNADTIHGYLGFDLFMTELRRGEAARALDGLLSEAAHTTACHGGFEYGSASRRDYGKNLSPHGCWAAKYVALLRDGLLREEGDTLHLGSALSPSWVEPGQAVRVRDAPTDFGPVSYTLEGQPGGGRLTLRLPTGLRARGLKRVVLHAPVDAGFLDASAPGSAAAWDAGKVTLTSGTREVDLRWALPVDAARWTTAAYLRRYCFPPVVPQATDLMAR